MRELAKSLFSFSWAASLFGLQQVVNLTKPDKAEKAFNTVADAAAKGLDDTMKAAFQTGDRLQRGMVDTTFSIFSGEGLDPSRLMKTTSDLLRQSAETMSQGFNETTRTIQSFTQKQTGTSASDAAANDQSEGSGPIREASRESQSWGPIPGSSAK